MTTFFSHAVCGHLRLEGDESALQSIRFLEEGAPRHEPESEILREAVEQIREYCEGSRTAFALPLDHLLEGFQKRVLTEVQQIPFGQTASYGEIALRLQTPGAARAVGLANARNPLPIIIPCHRVIGRHGKLTGFAGGLPLKRRLLEHEAQIRAARRPAEPAQALLAL